MQTHYAQLESYVTKDGSTIRELLHPNKHGNKNQSLAEATVPKGIKTELHLHKLSEEIYFITEGKGLMTLDKKTFPVSIGDTIYIPQNTAHQIENTGQSELKFICACSPAYSHEDTVLL